MISVRVKLFALVAGSFIPALIGAIATQQSIEKRMLTDAAENIHEVQLHFDDSMDEYQKNARIALTFATESTWFTRALAEQDKDRVGRFIERLSKVYKYRAVTAANSSGTAVAADKPLKGGAVIEPTAGSPTAQLLQGDMLFGLVSVAAVAEDGKPVDLYAIMAGTPVKHEDKRVGSVALFSFISDSYVEYLKRNLGADLALNVNGKLVASTKGHPAPHLRAENEDVIFEESAKHLFAVKTFKPAALQTAGISVELTASRDVTHLRKAAQATLFRELAILAGASLLILALALRFASRTAAAISGIAQAARSIKNGTYQDAPIVHSRDELETLTLDFNEMVAGLQERDRLKETFGRYVTRQVADHLMQGNQALGGELVPVTVLFSDIRSFTSISENMDPRELLDFLNEYFSGMVESVLQHHGVVDKFIGDAIMAVFGAPVPEPEDPLHAVRAALAMRERLAKINEDFRARGLPEIRTGIGLHSGQVVAGNMGHSERMEYTVIGDTVNLASRLEGMTKELGCDVVVSEDLYMQVKDAVEVEPLRKIRVKGRDQEVMVYRLIGLVPEPS